MTIRFYTISKTTDDYLKQAVETYRQRLKHYVDFSMEEVLVKAAATVELQLLREAEKMLTLLKKQDYVVLLDERGKQHSSEEFAGKIARLQNQSVKSLVFIAGSAYGFHPLLHERADEKFALSRLTFTHQMVRLIFTEQLYRAFTILRNEKYHH